MTTAREEAERRWVPVVGYEGYYEISDTGDVKRVHSGKGAIPGIKKRQYDKHGYRIVVLSKKTVHKRFFVHRLVLEAFVGPCPDGFEGCHNDGNPSNCSVSNLRWDTHKGNESDKKRHGTNTSWLTGRKVCRNGHPWTPENTSIRPNGYRRCKSCDRAAEARRREKYRAVLEAALGEEA